MLKYLYVKEVFQEVPSEISLGISISGCKIKCPECNQKELWKNIGRNLTVKRIEELLNEHQGITCLLLFGGEHDIDSLIEIFMFAHKRVKTAWYCGLDKVPPNKKGIYQYLDFIKLGHYDSALGGLDSPTTNQRLYKLHINEDGLVIADQLYLYQKPKKPFKE